MNVLHQLQVLKFSFLLTDMIVVLSHGNIKEVCPSFLLPVVQMGTGKFNALGTLQWTHPIQEGVEILL